MENNRCEECKIELLGKRKGAKYCSPKCRKDASRRASVVTDNVTLSEPAVKQVFKYIMPYKRKPGDPGYDAGLASKFAEVMEAEYWYDVPIGAIPVIKDGWPKMPDYMNGRQYFLWMKNEFKEGDNGPTILNPFPVRDKIEYVKAGEGS